MPTLNPSNVVKQLNTLMHRHVCIAFHFMCLFLIKARAKKKTNKQLSLKLSHKLKAEKQKHNIQKHTDMSLDKMKNNPAASQCKYTKFGLQSFVIKTAFPATTAAAAATQ